MTRVWSALSVATAGLILMGTSSMAVADEGSTGADEKEEQQIRVQLQTAPELRNNHIEVDVDDGIAVLEGTVDSAREKKAAQQLAHVGGILGVNNRLEVRGAGK
jgi:osmotically-inducible protein OsmY